MKLYLVGANYRTAPLEMREQIALTVRDKCELMAHFIADERVAECLILTTCNRTELYLLIEKDSASEIVWDWLMERTGETLENLQRYTYEMRDLQVVEHLMRVACGLDSMVLGEEQILGQVRTAYHEAIEQGSISSVFHQMVSDVLRVGKQVRTETGIARSGASIASAGVELVKGHFPQMGSLTAMVLGAGEMATLALESLQAAGVRNLIVVNRSLEKGLELAERVGGRAIFWEEKLTALREVDLVITSTSAPHYVITREELVDAWSEQRPLILMDIAVPRDVEPAVAELPWVRVYNIDDLQQMAVRMLTAGGVEIQRAEQMIAEEVEKFAAWLKARWAHPIIREFRERAEGICRDELAKAHGQLESLGVDGQALVQDLTRKIVAKLLHEPTVQMKELALAEEGDSYLRMVCKLYNLHEPEQMREGSQW